MQESILKETQLYLSDFQGRVETSNTLARIFQKFSLNIRQSFASLADNLELYAEDFYNDLSKTPEENEVNLFHYNQLSNTILNLSHALKEKLNDLFTESIEPFQQFSQNFEETNLRFVNNLSQLIKNIEQSRSAMLQMQEDYLRSAYELDKITVTLNKKKEKSKKMVHYAQLKSKTDDLFVKYRNQIVLVNSKWERYNSDLKTEFDSFDLNEQSRTHITQLTAQKTIKTISELFIQLSNNITTFQQSSENKLIQIEEKNQRERMPTIKHITRNRKFNVLKVTKKEEFISFEDWKKNFKASIVGISHQNYQILDPFDSNSIQKLKVEQNIEHQIEFLISKVKECTLNSNEQDCHVSRRQQTTSLEDILSTLRGRNDKNKYDLETVFNSSLLRQNFLERVLQIMEQAPSDKIIIENQTFDEMQAISRAIIISVYFPILKLFLQDFQNEQKKGIEEFQNLILFSTFYGRKSKNGAFESIGALVTEKTSLFFERDLWQQLLVKMNEKENLNPTHKIKSKDIVGLLQYGKHKNKIPMTQDQKVNYLKKMQNLQRICFWMQLLNLRVDFAGDTMILLSKMCQIRVSDIVLFLEQFESLKILQQNTEQYQQQQTIPVYKNRFDPYISIKQKQFKVFKKIIKYLNPEDQINVLQVCKNLSTLAHKVCQKQLCYYPLQPGLSLRRKMLWIKQLDPQAIKLDYYQLKEKYSKLADASERTNQLETLIAQDVQRSFNTQGMYSIINHLTLLNLLKLYAYYNPTISYTQGMNFVMGFIYLVFEDEELTFRCFTSLIQMFLKDVLMYDLKNIRVFFYKLDRLLAIFLPELSQHLKQEKIEAGLYAAPWFITFFTGSFMKNKFSDVIFEVWDVLLSRGWCGFFQVLLAIFQTFKLKMLKMKFDYLLQFLNNLVKCEFFVDDNKQQVNMSLKNLKKTALSFNITQGLLNDLDKEYYMVRQKINSLMNY